MAATLSGTKNASTAAVALATVGPTDWVKWENSANAAERSASGGSLISNWTALGGTSPTGFGGDARTFSWTGGTPTASGSNSNGVFGNGGSVGSGFSFTVPADTTTRMLRLYVGGYNCQGTLTATLSDGSAAPLTIVGNNNSGGAGPTNYEITFEAGSGGQTLTLAYTMAVDNGSGNVSMCAAALDLAGPPPTPATPVSRRALLGVGF